MNKATKILVALVVLVLAAPAAFAQPNGYTSFPLDLQSKNSPAGLVNEPGSQLIYLLDSGVNAKEQFGADADYASKSVMDLGGVDGANFANFISVTNTNPTDAVTVHFRYIASYRVPTTSGYAQFCEDVLDFLVVLTCNDTMLIDPFDYDIPGTSLNVKDRFFASATAPGVLKGIPAQVFDDGRFFLFVTASGNTNGSQFADIRYPKELISASDLEHCDGDVTGNWGPYIGTVSGISDDNLHILNASAVSFNFLTGFSTIAVPTAFINAPEGANDLAYGVTAYARPAVDLTADDNNGRFGDPDGDGPPAPKWVVLAGNEEVYTTNDVNGPWITNPWYLRQDAHNGDTDLNIISNGGALGWTLFPIEGTVQGIPPVNQFLFMVSMVDDYNGSNNVKALTAGTPFNDNSYGIDGALTKYDLLVYNNDEELLELDIPEIPVSPPPPFEQIALEIFVQCFDAYDNFPTAAGSVEFDDFSVADLYALGGQEVIDWLQTPVAVNDEKGPGWIRMQRVQTQRAESFDGNGRASFFTVAQSVNRFEGFGASWWLPTAAYGTVVVP